MALSAACIPLPLLQPDLSSLDPWWAASLCCLVSQNQYRLVGSIHLCCSLACLVTLSLLSAYCLYVLSSLNCASAMQLAQSGSPPVCFAYAYYYYSGSNLNPFCNILSGRPGDRFTCPPSRNFLSTCNLVEYISSLPTDRQV